MKYVRISEHHRTVHIEKGHLMMRCGKDLAGPGEDQLIRTARPGRLHVCDRCARGEA